MTMKKSVAAKSSSPSPLRYMKPGALAKLRNSKITATNHRYASRKSTSLSQLLSTPTHLSSPYSTDGEQLVSPNQDNGIPCFTSRVDFHRPKCFTRKKLFAVTPTFTVIDSHQI
ncbi:hypothetical protein Lal_00022678 [Lupinus albus]|nr:hypothetical protein Lal_00022678 [Lupinus albus]